MIGKSYWATGITVACHGEGRWSAEVSYLDDGFCSDDPDKGIVSTEGTLRTRYQVQPGDSADVLSVVVDVIKADAERLGIRFEGAREPTVYYKGDGEWDDFPLPPYWRETVNAQATRLGWRPLYAVADADAPDPVLALRRELGAEHQRLNHEVHGGGAP